MNYFEKLLFKVGAGLIFESSASWFLTVSFAG